MFNPQKYCVLSFSNSLWFQTQAWILRLEEYITLGEIGYWRHRPLLVAYPTRKASALRDKGVRRNSFPARFNSLLYQWIVRKWIIRCPMRLRTRDWDWSTPIPRLRAYIYVTRCIVGSLNRCISIHQILPAVENEWQNNDDKFVWLLASVQLSPHRNKHMGSSSLLTRRACEAVSNPLFTQWEVYVLIYLLSVCL
jgi:hypothetical protein